MFAFSIGHQNIYCKANSHRIDDWKNIFIYNDHLIFRSGKWIDAIYLQGGNRHGTIGPHGSLRDAIFIDDDEFIDQVGLLSYQGMNVIPYMKITQQSLIDYDDHEMKRRKTRLSLIPGKMRSKSLKGTSLSPSRSRHASLKADTRSRHASKADTLPVNVDVTSGSTNSDKTYAYKRENLGLNINIIAVGTSQRGVQAMTWAFHRTNDFDFNRDEFKIFWDWLMNEIYISQKKGKENCQCCFCIQKENEEKVDTKEQKEITKEEISTMYAAEYNYVVSLFEKELLPPQEPKKPANKRSRKHSSTDRNESKKLVQSNKEGKKLNVAIDQGDILILNTKDISIYMNRNGTCHLLIQGRSIDTSGGRSFNTSGLPSDRKQIVFHLIGDAIAKSCSDEQFVKECVDIHVPGGKYIDGPNAQSMAYLFAHFGANLVLRDEDQEDWDIYNVCAMNPTAGKLFSSFICITIQILSPCFLAVAAITDHPHEMIEFNPVGSTDWMTRILAAVVFGYLFAWNSMLTKRTTSERKLAFFLILYTTSEEKTFQRNFVLGGLLVNTIAYFLICIGSIIILVYTDNPIDVILNSIALFFIKDIDNDLVDSEYITAIQEQSEDELAKLFSIDLSEVFDIDRYVAWETWNSLHGLGHVFSKVTLFSKMVPIINMVLLLSIAVAILIFQINLGDEAIGL